MTFSRRLVAIKVLYFDLCCFVQLEINKENLMRYLTLATNAFLGVVGENKSCRFAPECWEPAEEFAESPEKPPW